MRVRHVPILIAVVIAAAAVLAAAIAGPASATPGKTSACTSCHSGAASGAVTATPSTTTPAAGASYTVAISIGLTASGNTGYHIAQTDAGGTITSWTNATGGPAAQTPWTATMTAPAAPGTYYYTVWCAKGPNNSSGMGRAATYSITVPAPNAAITSLSPASGPVGATLTISGTGMGASGTVTVGGVGATINGWSTTSITCMVPAGLTVGAKDVVVTPAGRAASNALPFTVTVPPATTAALTRLTPNHAQAGASVVIAGTDLGSAGIVRFGTTIATTSAWSATSVTATVPAGLAAGATSVTVTPTSGVTSNGLAFTLDVSPAPRDPTAPTTSAGGVTSGAWCNYEVTVTLTAADNAGGTGVAAIVYAVDGHAPITVAGGTATVTIGAIYAAEAAHAVQGAHTITYYATDAAGNAEAAHSLTVNMDTYRPATRAPRAAVAKRFRKAALKYEVRDATPNAGTADVVITIKNRRGRVVKKLHLGAQPVNTALTARFTCSLRPGTYRFSVRARDAAGNTQVNIAAQKLTVRAAQ